MQPCCGIPVGGQRTTLWELVLSFYHVASGRWTQVLRLGGEHPSPLSYITGPTIMLGMEPQRSNRSYAPALTTLPFLHYSNFLKSDFHLLLLDVPGFYWITCARGNKGMSPLGAFHQWVVLLEQMPVRQQLSQVSSIAIVFVG